MDAFQPGEIICCDMYLTIKNGSKVVLNKIIFSRGWEEDIKSEFLISNEKDRIFLNKHNISKDAKLIKLNIITRLGFKNKNNKQ